MSQANMFIVLVNPGPGFDTYALGPYAYSEAQEEARRRAEQLSRWSGVVFQGICDVIPGLVWKFKDKSISIMPLEEPEPTV